LERVVGALDGVEAAEVSFGAGTLSLWGNVPPERVLAAVAGAGFRGRPFAARGAEPPTTFWRHDRRALSTLAAMALLVAAVLVDVAGATRVVVEPAYLASMAVGGWPIARAAAAALRRRSLDMNVLMTLAAVGAVGIGSYAEGAWVLVLFALGTTLETYALDRTRRSVESLAHLAPAHARVVDGGVEQTVPVESVPVGSTIALRPGERLPLDGVVVSGDSSVDESPVTGESVPVDKTAGSNVYAGTLNQYGALEVRTTRDAASSTISRIVELVEQAQATRAPSERLVDRFARIYTPLVVVAAVLVAVVPALLGGDLSTWVYRALALLIVACPCSLVISIPVAVVSAIGAAARSGVLVKGGAALEDLAAVRVVCFDKTGTLTHGVPRLAEILPAADLSENEALRLVATVERGSEHPLGAALVHAARDRALPLGEPQRFLALPGRGVDALVDGRALWAGGPRLARERLDPGAVEGFAALEAAGRTVLALGEQGRLLALFGLADTARPEAAGVVDQLRREGRVARVVMLTGDNDAVARAIGSETGIAEWHASLLPDDKLRLVESLEAETGAVAMIGDGVNDAPALATARVGVAMGVAGTGIALDTADVALMSDDLGRLPEAINLARRAVGVMRQNIVASLLVKGAVLMLVPFGLVTLWMAVAADMGMSLLVTANGLRLLRRARR
jgi:Cd2+/Zn2+-exporting ATPase